MKLKNIFGTALCTGMLGLFSSNSATAQNVLPDNALPVIVANDTMSVDFRENYYRCGVEANVPFEVEKVDSAASWVKFYKKSGDPNFYIYCERNSDMHPRSARLNLVNKKNGMKELIVVNQDGDRTIYPEDFTIVNQNLIRLFFDGTTAKSDENYLDTFLDLLKVDGSFSDIDYSRKDRMPWPPEQHYFRMIAMAKCYINPKSKYYKSDYIYSSIVNMLEFWYKVYPRSNNWWYNQIGYPSCICQVLLIMREGDKKIPKDLENRYIARIFRDGGHWNGQSGANKVWIATCCMYQSVLSKDTNRLKAAMEAIYEPLNVRVNGGEGIQVDNSFLMHGPQFYAAGYGFIFVLDILKVAQYIETTKFACFTKEQMNTMSNYVRNCIYKITRGRSFMFTTRGREITRGGDVNPALAHYAMKVDTVNRQEYEDIILRTTRQKPASYHVKPSNTYFYKADYMVHVRPEFSFDVRMVSKRTFHCEDDVGNGENFFGHYLSYGSTNILRDGEEYRYTPIFWDWDKIPGTTAPRYVPKPSKGWRSGTTDFAGAVSDSLYAAVGFYYYDSWDNVNTGVNKAYFCFDKEVVCLGRVSSTAPQNVMTTLNQSTNFSQPIYRVDGKNSTLPFNDSIRIKNPEWIFHNNIGYVVPQGGELEVVSKRVRTTHYHINHAFSKDSVEGDVCSIALEHGVAPQDSPYAYILVPSVNSADELHTYCQNIPVEILVNTTKTQAVYHKTLNIWQAICAQPSTVSHNGVTIEADRRCAWMLKKLSNGKYQLHVEDPSYSQSIITLRVTLPGQSAKTIKANFQGTHHHAGKSKAFIL